MFWFATTAYANGQVIQASAFVMDTILFQAQNRGERSDRAARPTIAARTSSTDDHLKSIATTRLSSQAARPCSLLARDRRRRDHAGHGRRRRRRSGQPRVGRVRRVNDSGVAAFKAAMAGVPDGLRGGVGLAGRPGRVP
jgi:hypothetical protein